MQTALDLSRLIRHTIGDDSPSEVPTIQIINEAGSMLVNMHRWRWLERPAVSLDTTATQEWIALPTDFGEIISLMPASSLLGSVTPASMSQIDNMRAAAIATPTGSFWYAVEFLGSAAQNPPTPRLAIWPTPTTSTVGALILRYRAGWTLLGGDSDVAVVPGFCEGLLRQCVVICARGYLEEDEMTLAERFEVLAGSALYHMARQRDGMTQQNVGPMQGGAVADMGPTTQLYNPDARVADPTSV